MKNIFAVTKTEQRVVIFIVVALVGLGAIRAYRQKITNPAPPNSGAAVQKPPFTHREEEPVSADEAP